MDSEWVIKDKSARAHMRWQFKMLDGDGFTEDHYYCIKCKCRHSKTAQKHEPHRKFAITSAMWKEGEAQ